MCSPRTLWHMWRIRGCSSSIQTLTSCSNEFMLSPQRALSKPLNLYTLLSFRTKQTDARSSHKHPTLFLSESAVCSENTPHPCMPPPPAQRRIRNHRSFLLFLLYHTGQDFQILAVCKDGVNFVSNIAQTGLFSFDRIVAQDKKGKYILIVCWWK